MKISLFAEQVYRVTRQIPRGKVATYSQIARLIDNPKSYRAVGNALHKNPFAPQVPCHRVVSAKGDLAIKFGAGGKIEQQKRLGKEGIIFKKEGKVNLTKYQFEFK